MKKQQPVLLAILDGWGIGKHDHSDAVFLSKTPNLDMLSSTYPHTQLVTNGLEVGLPRGIMGNSEVGHQNIGAGRIVYQQLTAINLAIENGSFFTNPEIHAAFEHAKTHETALHLMGLLSDGGVHSDLSHLYALLRKAKDMGLSRVYIHVILDGRDTPPDSGKTYLSDLLEQIRQIGVGEIVSMCGRYFAMDRDNNYDRVRIAYDALMLGKGLTAHDPMTLLNERYANKEFDEFIRPTLLTSKGNIRHIQTNDAVIFTNFRPDRAREITRALLGKVSAQHDKKGAFNGETPPPLYFVSMTQYQDGLNEHVAFPPQPLTHTLGEVISRNGLLQLRIAETEKYAHVTFFFNGGEEKVFPGEDRILVDSPKDVEGLYDRKPEMSAFEVTEKLLEALETGDYDLVILNFANMDMVGHTGKMDAAIRAVEAVDTCVGHIWAKVKSMNGVMLITADHGNADDMTQDNGEPMTAHSMNKVPLIVAGYDQKISLRAEGKLADIAPTILQIMGIPQPVEMTGESLINLSSMI